VIRERDPTDQLVTVEDEWYSEGVSWAGTDAVDPPGTKERRRKPAAIQKIVPGLAHVVETVHHFDEGAVTHCLLVSSRLR
jgi:hypothetical protein